jgi:hypothetical protein
VTSLAGPQFIRGKIVLLTVLNVNDANEVMCRKTTVSFSVERQKINASVILYNTCSSGNETHQQMIRDRNVIAEYGSMLTMLGLRIFILPFSKGRFKSFA